MIRPLPLAAGLGALSVGLGLAASGLVAGPVLRAGFLLAAVAAAAGGAVSLVVRSLEGPTDRSLGHDPNRPGVERPGEGIDRRLAAAADGDVRAREELTDRLEDAAVAVLARRAGIDRERARERLRAGEWTDDHEAAALFAAEGPHRPSLTDRVRRALGGESSFRRRFERATEALAGLAGGDRD